jgi:hypothetical protein
MANQFKAAIQIPYVTKSDYMVYNIIGCLASPIPGGFRQNVHHQRLSPDFVLLAKFDINKQPQLFLNP